MDRRIVALSCALTVVTPAVAAAQSAGDFMREVTEDYQNRMSGIRDYTVSQTFMNTVTTMHFERHDVDGRIVFLPNPQYTMMDGRPMGDGTQDQEAVTPLDGYYFMQPEVMDRARIEGSAQVDGQECWIIVLDDFEGLDLDLGAQGAGDFTPEVLRMFMDKDEYVARKMEFTGTMTSDTGVHEISSSTLMTDYREVEGMLYPFRIEISTELPEGAGMGVNPAQADAQRSVAEQMMEQMGEDLTDAERAMIEGMLNNEGGGGLQDMLSEAMSTMVVETTELKVNAGPPGGDR